ncbi:protein phosphatase [Strigomonas culicis]|uniref:Protein phosphatase n=1 Tax=Strigomonas culicis TaxID=28005 RepID=S9VGX0_9TRYP|nr:protein phosphatase [Strigomonas culicis]EPY37146.1 protein phosphatase [Strigomonas culicis]|eukprot:EPY26311.1 protein phosphatase [Strigomonas culicis]
MSDLLAKPETQKFSTVFETKRLRVGCCNMQGWRKTMEDAHVTQLNIGGVKTRAFFGVFDGHQSDEAARFCRSHMLDEVLKALDAHPRNYQDAFETAFKCMDDLICHKFAASGTAAVCVYLDQDKIVCANAGDSRAVLFRSGNVIPLSSDHKPYHEGEEKRIVKAGCAVENGRVNMTLAVSRALGDLDFKQAADLDWKEQAVTALPDVTITELTSDDEFIILGCDGIWDVLSNEKCCDFVREHLLSVESLGEGMDIAQVCECLLDECLSTTNTVREGTDNMTVVLVQFKKK